MTLTLSSDRKTAPAQVWRPGKQRWEPLVRNAFGLPSGITCPGKTPWCVACYAVDSERYPSTAALLARNLAALVAAATVDGMAELLAALIADYRDEHARACKRAARTLPLTFRIHWDGDFYSVDYAAAWALVIRANPDVRFWAYTRSFDAVNAVPTLAGIGNLALYLSADRYNVDRARAVAATHRGVRIAWCGDTWEEAASLPGATRAGARCPVQTKRIPLVSDAGQGGCDACTLCIAGKGNVRFSSRH